MKKLLVAVASLAVLAAPLAASAQSWGHGEHGGWSGGNRGGYQGRGNWGGDYRRGDNGGAALTAGLFGLFLGSAIASSHSYDYDRPYGYNAGYYGDRCGWENQPYQDRYGDVEYRQVEVCR